MYSDEKSIIPFPSTLAVFFSIIVSIFVCILPFIRMHVHRHPLSQSSRYTTVESAPKQKMMRDILVRVYFAIR